MLSEKDYTAHTIKLVFMTKHFRDLYIYIYMCVCVAEMSEMIF